MKPGCRFYSKTVTYDTSAAAGAPGGCTDTLRSAFQVLTASIKAASKQQGAAEKATLERLIGARSGRRHLHAEHDDSTAQRAASSALTGAPTLSPHEISKAMAICKHSKLDSVDDIIAIRDWAAAAFDMMAMGARYML